MQTFHDVFEDIKSKTTVSKSGKVKRTFSRTDFDRLLKAMLNEPEYAAEYCGTKGGEMVKTTVQPVKMFRESLKRILVNFGVDVHEAEKMVTDYKFTNVDGWYETMSEIIYQYMQAGKKFDFPTRENCKASIFIKPVEETVGTYSTIRKKDDPTPAETFQVQTMAHNVVVAKSKAPDWMKKKFKK